MENKFDNYQVGDKVMKLVECFFSAGGVRRFEKIFFVEMEIERATKTEITVDGYRYKRNGVKVGKRLTNDLFIAGEIVNQGACFGKLQVPKECQRKEMNEYNEKLSKAFECFIFDASRYSIPLELALEMSDVIEKIKGVKK